MIDDNKRRRKKKLFFAQHPWAEKKIFFKATTHKANSDKQWSYLSRFKRIFLLLEINQCYISFPVPHLLSIYDSTLLLRLCSSFHSSNCTLFIIHIAICNAFCWNRFELCCVNLKSLQRKALTMFYHVSTKKELSFMILSRD